MQAARDLIAAAAEFAARVQDRKDHRDRGQAGLVLDAHRDTAPVVRDADHVAGQDHHVDLVAVPGQRFVDRIVHDLIDQMVQAARPGGADVHARALPDSLQPLQHLDLVFVVCLIRLQDFVYIHVT